VEAELEEARQEWARALSKLPQADVARHLGITRQAVAHRIKAEIVQVAAQTPELFQEVPSFESGEGGYECFLSREVQVAVRRVEEGSSCWGRLANEQDPDFLREVPFSMSSALCMALSLAMLGEGRRANSKWQPGKDQLS
jgi:hypothetical protein